MIPPTKIPDRSDWYGYEDDLDVPYMRDLFYGKSNEEVQEYFGENRSIERAAELLSCPRAVFQYYVFAFAHFLISERAIGDPDSASPFLGLLEAREKLDPGSVQEIYSSLEECVAFVASKQAYFEAPIEIYGDFRERYQDIRKACVA